MNSKPALYLALAALALPHLTASAEGLKMPTVAPAVSGEKRDSGLGDLPHYRDWQQAGIAQPSRDGQQVRAWPPAVKNAVIHAPSAEKRSRTLDTSTAQR